MIDQFINFVIRPPRAEYNPDQYLWEEDFTIAGRQCKRQDLELQNGRGHTLKCTHYVPSPFPASTPLPCVIYCHGNSGCRADANDAAAILLALNITVFTLDFSGSGLSGGDYVSLGLHEKDDLKTVVSFLRNNKQISCIGLWGRSMGAVTSLLYGSEDPSIAGIVLDSAFSNLIDLMMELVDVYKIRLPKFTVKVAIQYMRHVIQKKAKFDIMDLNCLQVAPKTFIPALFGHANEDIFVKPHHSDRIFSCYAGDKNIIKFDGDHNSPRPQFYYDSVSIFFFNVLHPPQISLAVSSKVEKYYDLGDLKVAAGMDESLLYEIITGLRAVGTDAASSSSNPPCTADGRNPATNSVLEVPSETRALTDAMDSLLGQGDTIIEVDGNDGDDPRHLQITQSHVLGWDILNSHLFAVHVAEDKVNSQNEECCSFSSSNRESWGRCSSLGGCSDDETSSVDCRSTSNSHQDQTHQTALRVLATPLRRIQRKSDDRPKEKQVPAMANKSKREKLEAISQRLRRCIPVRGKHKRHLSS